MANYLVVPLYNEERRFAGQDFAAFALKHPGVHFLLVNDGSSDHTATIIDALTARYPAVFTSLHLPANCGKAEAVRRGMAQVLSYADAVLVGYFDADQAAPVAELEPMLSTLQAHPATVMLLASRVRLLGKQVERRFWRHILGRIFATVVSRLLAVAVYDTQCGAKLFRASPAVAAVFAERFHSRWIFDVEIIARLAQQLNLKRSGLAAVLYELPVRQWHDIKGSKLKSGDFVKAALELAFLHRHYRSYLR